MSEDRVYRVRSADREVSPAFTLSQIGKVAHKRVVNGENYERLNLVTTQLMCALSLEAVMNRVGYKLFIEDASEPAVWDAVERLRPREKLVAIAERAGLQLDWGRLPLQDFDPIFAFRRELAHAKYMHLFTTAVPPEAVDDSNWVNGDAVPALQASWERVCNVETAGRWRESVYAISALISEAAGCADPIRFGPTSGFSGGWELLDGG